MVDESKCETIDHRVEGLAGRGDRERSLDSKSDDPGKDEQRDLEHFDLEDVHARTFKR